MACLSVLPPIFCNTHIRLAGSCFPILAPSPLFCLFAKHFHTAAYPRSLVSYFSAPLSYRVLFSSPVTGLLHCLNLCPPCYCFSSSSFLSPFSLFRLARAFLSLPFSDTACNVFVSFRRFALPRPSLGFIKGRFPPCCACRRALPFSAPLFWARLPYFVSLLLQNIATQPPIPARLLSFFSPLVRPFLLSLLVTGFLPQTLSVLLLFCLTDAFPLCSLLMPPFKALFFLVCIFVSRAASHYTFPKTNCRLATLTAAPVCFYPFSFFSHALFFWHVYLALPCPNKAQRVFVSLFLSAFLPGCLSSFISVCFYKPLFPGIPAKIPLRASFLRTKNRRCRRFCFSL